MHQQHGRCLCGSVHFTISAPAVATRVCWCRDCQHIASNGTVNLIVPTSAIEITGALSEYVKTAASGNLINCRFCPKCGSHLFATSSARPQFTGVRAGNLDQPSEIQPGMNIWTESAPSWACLNPLLEQVQQQPAPPPPLTVKVSE
jgi:hypothetical protein